MREQQLEFQFFEATLEEICKIETLRRAFKSVKRNKGAWSSRQGCTLAGESPAIPIAQFGYIAMPQPGAGNQPGSCVVYKASLPSKFECERSRVGAIRRSSKYGG